MKFYCLRHPTLGYLTSKSSYSNNWSGFIGKCKKWSARNHVSNVKVQSHSNEIKECEILELEYIIVTPHLTRMITY